MKKSILVLAVLAMQSVAFAQKKGSSDVFSPTNPAALPAKTNAVDLKAESITFSLVQGVNLSENQSTTFPNPVGPTTVKKDQLFSTLAAGATFQISYGMDWYKGNEFPPIFRLNITFDPDITMDGNTGNDDAVYANNKLEIDGKATINAKRW